MIDKILSHYDVILASGSPRRKEIFSFLGIKARILPADIAEPLSNDEPFLQALAHACNKANAVAGLHTNSLVVAADTLVAVQGQVLGKPGSPAQAKDFLRLLSGKEHEVYSAICIQHQGTVLKDYACTEVAFAPLSETEIDDYLSTGEPLDKAGAYGIQGFGAQFISSVRGCYFNVMGFPVHTFYNLLKQLPQKVL